MAKLKNASADEIQHLLELFPLSVLKQNWDNRGRNKEEICAAIAKEVDYRKIATFVTRNFARCKQHSYVLLASGGDSAEPEASFPYADPLGTVDGKSVYLGVAKYTVLLRDPFEQAEVNLLWPMRVEQGNNATIVSFIVMEKDVPRLFDREVINSRRHVDEKLITQAIRATGYDSVDLNKGVKTLWSRDYMDAFKVKFKKPRPTTTESMDRERGIKATEPELYKEMQRLPIYESMFRVSPKSESSVDVFQVNPTEGSIRMTRYTEGQGDSDEIVEAILSKNF